MAFLRANINSQYLGGNTHINFILPDKAWGQDAAEFYSSGARYKVLWLLHGGMGDYSDWVRKSDIELYATEKNLIVVMPSALNSSYANIGGYNMYDFLVKELMPFVYNWLPASDKREDNYIAGLSMGGGGTLKYVLGFPDKFAGAAVLSAAASDPREMFRGKAGGPMAEYAERMKKEALEKYGSEEGYLASEENLWDRLKEKSQAGLLPKFYCACGTKDFGIDGFRKFEEYARSFGLEAKFEEIEGYAHEWRFWDLTIQHALEYWGVPDNTVTV